jgi:hypothetical protein
VSHAVLAVAILFSRKFGILFGIHICASLVCAEIYNFLAINNSTM